MTPQDYSQFVTIWTQASELYNKAPSDGALDLIFNALQRFDLEQIKQGLTAHINDPKHGDFAPKPADIVRHIEGDGDSRALAAWSAVDRAIRSVGPYESVVFDDPRTMATIEDMGGWMKLCEVTDKDLPFKGNEFVKRFMGYLSRPPEKFPAKLLGMTEASNSGEHSEFVPEPRLIGKPKLCLEVMRKGSEKKQGHMRLSDALDRVASQLESKGDVA
ncbi:MAG: DUF6475 domain-containing protein [Marinobacter sp.]|jgi:hypothetical protein